MHSRTARAVEQRFHLPGHFIIIDRRCEHEHVRLQRLLPERVRVVVDHAALRLLTDEAAPAELHVFAAQRDQLDLVPGFPRAGSERIRQRLGVAAPAGACGNNKDLFHVMLLLKGMRRCRPG